MTFQLEQMTSAQAEAEILGEIAKYLHHLADEATERWRAALVRAEGTPLLDPLEGQTDFFCPAEGGQK
jgi:hypothetical protein